MADERAHPKGRDNLLKALGKMKVKIESVEEVSFNPTGILSLDIALHGGLPRGRMILWYGNKGTGKSTTAMLVSRELVNRGEHVLWLDYERTLDRKYAELLGLDIDLLDVVKPNTLEEGWNVMLMALESGAYSLIVWDTLAMASASTELAAGAEKQHMGLQPRINSQAIRMWASALEKSGTTVLMLNQERTNLSAYGAPNTNPGGKAIEHAASVTLYMGSRGKSSYVNNVAQNLIFRYTILKTKVFREPEPYFYNELQVDCSADHFEVNYAYELFMGAKVFGLLRGKDGQPWSVNNAFYGEENLGNGQAQVRKWFETPSELRDQIEAEVIQRIQNGTQAAVTDVQDTDTSGPGPEPEAPPEYDDIAGYPEGE